MQSWPPLRAVATVNLFLIRLSLKNRNILNLILRTLKAILGIRLNLLTFHLSVGLPVIRKNIGQSNLLNSQVTLAPKLRGIFRPSRLGCFIKVVFGQMSLADTRKWQIVRQNNLFCISSINHFILFNFSKTEIP